MSVKVVIERRLLQELPPDVLKTVNELRKKAMQQLGYITGETLYSDQENSLVVFSYWSSLDDWERWKDNEEREAIDLKLRPYVKGKPIIRYFEPAADYLKRTAEKDEL